MFINAPGRARRFMRRAKAGWGAAERGGLRHRYPERSSAGWSRESVDRGGRCYR